MIIYFLPGSEEAILSSLLGDLTVIIPADSFSGISPEVPCGHIELASFIVGHFSFGGYFQLVLNDPAAFFQNFQNLSFLSFQFFFSGFISFSLS